MLPTAYEFHWDLGHIVFLGVFYSVVTAVGITVLVAIMRGFHDLRQRRTADMDWRESCEELPAERRQCRHALTGDRPAALCDRGFACESCSVHAELCAAAAPEPGRRLYHRGHTWVEPQEDGTLKVGVEDLARRCFGRPQRLVLPAPGRTLVAGDRAVSVERGPLEVELFNPVGGEVVAQGDYEEGYLYRLRPAAPLTARTSLLDQREAAIWRVRELEALQHWLAPTGQAAALADGGLPMADLPAACPDADWDTVWGLLCLQD